MAAYKDLTGQRFGRLVAIRRTESYSNGKSRWMCECDCGKETVVDTSHLLSWHTRSCGCLHTETIKSGRNSRTHGVSKTRLYRIWRNMKSRCLNDNVPCHSYYGGRGIGISQEWEQFEPFYKWSMENGYTERLTLDRIDNNGNYEPSNCRWVSFQAQMNNTRSNHILSFRGEERTIAEWAREFNLPYQRVINRINTLGWSVEKALTTPINTKMGRRRNAERV